MGYITARTYLTGFAGGPCPGCGYVGELLEVHNDVEAGTRILVHGGRHVGTVISCTLPLRGMIITPPDGTWRYEPDWDGGPV